MIQQTELDPSPKEIYPIKFVSKLKKRIGNIGNATNAGDDLLYLCFKDFKKKERDKTKNF